MKNKRKKCKECGMIFMGSKEALWCNSCRKKKHELLFSKMKEGLSDTYNQCSHCKSLLKKEIKICPICGENQK